MDYLVFSFHVTTDSTGSCTAGFARLDDLTVFHQCFVTKEPVNVCCLYGTLLLGSNSSVVMCPPPNWKVGCSIHNHWVNCCSAPWAIAFTSTTPARSTIQASACRQLSSPKLTKKQNSFKLLLYMASALTYILCNTAWSVDCVNHHFIAKNNTLTYHTSRATLGDKWLLIRWATQYDRGSRTGKKKTSAVPSYTVYWEIWCARSYFINIIEDARCSELTTVSQILSPRYSFGLLPYSIAETGFIEKGYHCLTHCYSSWSVALASGAVLLL